MLLLVLLLRVVVARVQGQPGLLVLLITGALSKERVVRLLQRMERVICQQERGTVRTGPAERAAPTIVFFWDEADGRRGLLRISEVS